MLAAQQPSMGSSKPPNLEMPFGYYFDDTGLNYPFPSPPNLAPGPSLLDDNESKILDSFFDGVSSDQFNLELFNLDNASEIGMVLDEFPPMFMGNSSYGHQSQIGLHNGVTGMNYGSINTQLNPNISNVPPASLEVLQAAALLQNVPHGRRPNTVEVPRRNQEAQFLPTSEPMRAGANTQSVSRIQPIFQPRSHGGNFINGPVHSGVLFSEHLDEIACNQHTNQGSDIQWGSDANFASQGFIPHCQQNLPVSEAYQLHGVEANLTNPQNQSCDMATLMPIVTVPKTSQQIFNSLIQKHTDNIRDFESNTKRSIEVKEINEDDVQLNSPTNNNSAKKRKISNKDLVDFSTLEYEASQKRRRSTVGAIAKPTRENLTEEQKRENHIKSEQKRRTLIREGFEDLNDLVPGLQGGGFSKSAVLAQAADWLEELVQGNKILQARIDAIERNI
ncbi:BgTH12-03617 [Blumeria graminis f. sp. triticale]|uniref:Bgt-3290 n=3 Tax=Blumeria graminis TaxID=34373 RepID=A0A061HFZ1_BLUGR|nr:hypothetical protein BGT96224_3290 [Blumeria graminis f. sp. tritici 96224]CAD6499505.1 BgTH12-03617 [Blumeria graminis f. sp. triticale]VCU39672.1 Bgt-3290 [Blumeria graminis f. sp. tritici]